MLISKFNMTSVLITSEDFRRVKMRRNPRPWCTHIGIQLNNTGLRDMKCKRQKQNGETQQSWKEEPFVVVNALTPPRRFAIPSTSAKERRAFMYLGSPEALAIDSILVRISLTVKEPSSRDRFNAPREISKSAS